MTTMLPSERPDARLHTSCADVLDWLLREPRFAALAGLLDRLPREQLWLVGGAVRDFYLGHGADRVHDIDLAYTGDLTAALDALAGRYPIGVGPFGNPQITLAESTWADIFAPILPDGTCLPLEVALAHCESSGNAIAVSLGDGGVIDPADGRRDLLSGRTRLLPDGWHNAPPVLAALLSRLVDQHRRIGLRIVDIQVADAAYQTVADSPQYTSDDAVREAADSYRAWRETLPSQTQP